MFKNLYKCYLESDCSLLEVNPLVLTTDEEIIALDAKVDIDSNFDEVIVNVAGQNYQEGDTLTFSSGTAQAKVSIVNGGFAPETGSVDAHVELETGSISPDCFEKLIVNFCPLSFIFLCSKSISNVTLNPLKGDT